MNTKVTTQIATANEMRTKLVRAQSVLVDGMNLLELAGEKAQGNPDVACALVSAVKGWMDEIYWKIDEVVKGLSGDAPKGDGNG